MMVHESLLRIPHNTEYFYEQPGCWISVCPM